MSDIPNCPKCDSEFAYDDGTLMICPDCGHEWTPGADDSPADAEEDGVTRDAHGNVLESGDSVQLIKDLKVKGTSSTLKVGTKVKNIRLTAGPAGHDISCKIDGIGQMNLKSEFVKKVG